jgi:hypothetical protein
MCVHEIVCIRGWAPEGVRNFSGPAPKWVTFSEKWKKKRKANLEE